MCHQLAMNYYREEFVARVGGTGVVQRAHRKRGKNGRSFLVHILNLRKKTALNQDPARDPFYFWR